jgi:hypothetical protein
MAGGTRETRRGRRDARAGRALRGTLGMCQRPLKRGSRRSTNA